MAAGLGWREGLAVKVASGLSQLLGPVEQGPGQSQAKQLLLAD